jgi:hypothetical protein
MNRVIRSIVGGSIKKRNAQRFVSRSSAPGLWSCVPEQSASARLCTAPLSGVKLACLTVSLCAEGRQRTKLALQPRGLLQLLLLLLRQLSVFDTGSARRARKRQLQGAHNSKRV